MLLCVNSFSVISPIALKHKANSAFVIYSAEIELSKNKCAELTGTSIVGQRRNFSIRQQFTLSSLFINDGRLSFNFSLGNSNLKSSSMGTRSNYFGGDCVKYINFQPSVTGNYSSTTIDCKKSYPYTQSEVVLDSNYNILVESITSILFIVKIEKKREIEKKRNQLIFC